MRKRLNITNLSPEEKAVVFLSERYKYLLEVLNCGHVSFRIDLAFKSSSGVYFYSLNERNYMSNGNDLNMLNSDMFEEDLFSFDATNEEIKDLFRRRLDSDNHFRLWSIIASPRYLGAFDINTRVYSALVSYREEITPTDLYEELFVGLIRSEKDNVVRDKLQELEEIESPTVLEKGYDIARDSVLQFLSERFYDDKNDYRKEELYETLCLISCTPYEKAQNRGRLGILNENVSKGDSFIRFLKPITICKKNARQIRKLLEMSDKKANILIEDKGQIIGIHSQRGKYIGTGVAFYGNGKWDLFSNVTKSIISFNATSFELKDQSFRRRLYNSVKAVFKEDCDLKLIRHIIDEIKEQAHGTTVIFSDHAEDEVERLSKVDRVIPIEARKLEIRNLLSISAIDGAIILNPDGLCYGIGAILDGEAVSSGNMARGARYNSAITYVDSRKKKGEKTLAVIVSADDSTDIYPETVKQYFHSSKDFYEFLEDEEL